MRLGAQNRVCWRHHSNDPAVLMLTLGGVLGEKQKDQEWGLVWSQKAEKAGRADGSA